MKFLFPTFLFALLAVAIPVIIHLFSFRRHKTIYFSHVGFLKDVKKESQKKSRLKQLLMLLARILTIVFFVFAFSQPYIPSSTEGTAGRTEVVGVYIDNSFSMNALSKEGPLLERARNIAAEIGKSYPAGTRFRLLTNNPEPLHQHLFSREQFIQEVSRVRSSPETVPVSFIHNRFGSGGVDEYQKAQKTLYCISDFQRNMTDPENFSDVPVHTVFVPLVPNQVNNLYIDSCWVEVPAHGLNQEETVFVQISNNSNEDYQNLPLRLFLNDSLKSMTSFSVQAGKKMTTSLRFKNGSSGIQLGKVEITDYPFTHDNSWYFSYSVEPELEALALFNESRSSREGLAFISALFREDDYVRLETMDIRALQVSKLAGSHAIFLLSPDQFSSGFLNELEEAVSHGTSVVLFPGTDQPSFVNNPLLSRFGAGLVTRMDTVSQKISGIDFENRFFYNVFQEKKENALQPEIGKHLKFTKNIRTQETSLLWFQNGDKALSMVPYNQGKVWVFAFPLDESNAAFARDVIFVPTLYNIVLNSLPRQLISYTIGEDHSCFISGRINTLSDAPVELLNRSSGEKFIPEIQFSRQGVRLDPGNAIKTAGHYLVMSGDETLTSLSFNYHRNESDLSYFSADELENRVEQIHPGKMDVITGSSVDIPDRIRDIQKGKPLWKWCILLALFFILTEAFIARLWKQ
jgi:hypothetical protein